MKFIAGAMKQTKVSIFYQRIFYFDINNLVTVVPSH